MRGQDDRLATVPGVVIPQVHRFLIQLAEQRLRGLGEFGFGVPVRGRRVAVDGTEVPLAVDERQTHHPILREADERVVNRPVAVRVVPAHDVADDLRALRRLAVEREVRVVVHREQNAAVNRLQAVADVGQGPPRDH